MKRRAVLLLACLAVLGIAGWRMLRADEPMASGPHEDAPVLSAPEAPAPATIDLPAGFVAATPSPVALEPEAARDHAPGHAASAASTPSLRGRVVLVPGGGRTGGSETVAVPGARIAGQLSAKKHLRKLDLACGGDGRFEIPLQPPELALKSGSLVITHPQGLGRAERLLSVEDVARGGDLGDIELLAARPVHVLVRDAGATPVPGAIVVADDGTNARSGATDAQGRGVLPAVLLDTPSVTGWAHRYFAGHATLPAPEVVIDAEHPVVVVLERCPSLEVVVTDASGAPQPDLYAVLHGQQVLFADLDTSASLPDHMPRFAPNPMLSEVGAAHSRSTTWSSSFEDGAPVVSGSVSFVLGDDGRASISGLLPGTPFTLSVQDETDGLAWGPEPLTLHPGEVREVRATLAHAPVDLDVRVVDPQGTPLERAYVEVVREGQTSRSSPSTNAQGRVRLRRIYEDSVTLSVDRVGYVTRLIEDVAVARGGRPFEVELQPGVQVRVVVQDAFRRPVQAEMVSALIAGTRVGTSAPAKDGDAVAGAGAPGAGADARPAKPASAPPEPPEPVDRSSWLLGDLPRAELEIEAVVGGRRFAQAHDSRTPEAIVTVPGVGALTVSFGLALEETIAYALEVRSAGSAGPDRKVMVGPWERSVGELTFPSLLPGDYDVALFRWGEGGQVACSLPATARVTEGTTTTLALVTP